LGVVVGRIDENLRRRQGIVEHSRSVDCIFRMQLVTSEQRFGLSDGTSVRDGGRLVSLHFWNEHIPPFPNGRPSLVWALSMRRALDLSLLELEAHLANRHDLDDVVAIFADMALGSAAESDQLARIIGRYGFERRIPNAPRAPGMLLHRFGENILISMIVLLHNAAALRGGTLLRSRTLVFLSRAEIRRRYGAACSHRAVAGHGPGSINSACAGEGEISAPTS
jgi:hypothetical protein